MDEPTFWLSAPTEAYRQWQRTEAAGADRRAFSPRSIVQHEAMFERFMRHLAAAQRSLATFGPDHLESFFADLDRRCKPGTTTRLRYEKLLDRLGRHLVDVGVRKTNPAAVYTLTQMWPEDEPVPVYLLEADDRRLQASIRAIDGLDDRALRNRAIVGLLLSTGITAQEIRQATADDLDLSPARPHLQIPKRGPRESRRVDVVEFAVPALTRWRSLSAAADSPLLFPSPRAGGPMTDEMLGRIVRDELLAIDIRLPDMSPRTLRNTFARRLLLAGKSNDDVMRALGLTSQRTVVPFSMLCVALTEGDVHHVVFPEPDLEDYIQRGHPYQQTPERAARGRHIERISIDSRNLVIGRARIQTAHTTPTPPDTDLAALLNRSEAA